MAVVGVVAAVAAVRVERKAAQMAEANLGDLDERTLSPAHTSRSARAKGRQTCFLCFLVRSNSQLAV